jgi:hypothetical protein
MLVVNEAADLSELHNFDGRVAIATGAGQVSAGPLPRLLPQPTQSRSWPN